MRADAFTTKSVLVESIFDKLPDHPVMVYAIVIALAIIFGGLVILFFKWGRSNLLVFNNEDGRVEISRAAIQEIIQRTCEQFVEVGRARSDISLSKGYINIKVRLKLRVKTRLQEISNQLQKQITHAIRNDLGIKNLSEVNVVVEGFLAQVKPKA